MKTKNKFFLLGACLLGGATTAVHAETVVFSDSFNRARHSDAEFPPQWNPDGLGMPPVVSWVTDPARAPVDRSNGDFLEASRPVHSSDSLRLQSQWFDASLFQGREYELSFDFKAGADSRGRIDVRLQQGDGTAFNGTGATLFNQGSTIGDPDHGAGDGGSPREFDTISVGEPDANGWREITLTGEFFHPTLDWAFIEFQPWQLNGDVEAGHFHGSYAIDNVRLTTTSEPWVSPWDHESDLARAYLVTESLGFVHGVVVSDNGPSLVERIFRQLGEESGQFELAALDSIRFLTAEQLAEVDLVIFYTSGDLPFGEEGYEKFLSWIRGGGALVGVHSTTDTLQNHYDFPRLIGGTFDGHPWGAGATVTLKVIDEAHPASQPFLGGYTLKEEIYQFRNFDPENVRVLVSLDMENTELKKPRHVPVAWVREEGEGRVFYSSMGHRDDVWTNPDFQEHLKGGIGWALGKAEGEATPNPECQAKEEKLARQAYEKAKR